MLEFLFKLDLIFTTTRSLGARLGEVQAHQTRQFTLNMLDFFIKKVGFHFTTIHGQFKSASGGSSGAPNATVHHEHP
jgi:hypothetical protein